jgi:phosphoribosylglycinamide formyltransferase-1
MAKPLRLVALISGGGTTLQNLIDRAAAGSLGAEIVGVVSSRADVAGVERAGRAGLPVTVVTKNNALRAAVANNNQTPDFSPTNGGSQARQDAPPSSTPSGTHMSPFAERVWSAVRRFRPDLVCLAGWLHLIAIPPEFRHKVLNIHPSLLPAFGGKGMYGHHVHQAVLAYGSKVSGCTVHFADDTYDTGPILIQRSVPVKEGDDPDTLAARVFQAESEAYPEAIRLIAEGRVTIQGRRVVIS